MNRLSTSRQNRATIFPFISSLLPLIHRIAQYNFGLNDVHSVVVALIGSFRCWIEWKFTSSIMMHGFNQLEHQEPNLLLHGISDLLCEIPPTMSSLPTLEAIVCLEHGQSRAVDLFCEMCIFRWLRSAPHRMLQVFAICLKQYLASIRGGQIRYWVLQVLVFVDRMVV